MKARRVIYGCAMSLDGYITGPDGGSDWIVMDPEIDFGALMARFDTFLIGRKTYEVMVRMGSGGGETSARIRNIVCSRTLPDGGHPGMEISRDAVRTVQELRQADGKDIALFGGGELFRSLMGERLVDAVEVAVIPVLLGGGVPLAPPSVEVRSELKLREQRVYKKSGIVSLAYDVV